MDSSCWCQSTASCQRTLAPAEDYFFVNSDVWDREIGADVNPKNMDDFKRILLQLNRPQENRWAIGNTGGATGVADFLFGLQTYGAAFGAPNVWRLDMSGKFVRDRETEEYKAAVGYVRDLMAAALHRPTPICELSSRLALVSPERAGMRSRC